MFWRAGSERRWEDRCKGHLRRKGAQRGQVALGTERRNRCACCIQRTADRWTKHSSDHCRFARFTVCASECAPRQTAGAGTTSLMVFSRCRRQSLRVSWRRLSRRPRGLQQALPQASSFREPRAAVGGCRFCFAPCCSGSTSPRRCSRSCSRECVVRRPLRGGGCWGCRVWRRTRRRLLLSCSFIIAADRRLLLLMFTCVNTSSSRLVASSVK